MKLLNIDCLIKSLSMSFMGLDGSIASSQYVFCIQNALAVNKDSFKMGKNRCNSNIKLSTKEHDHILLKD